MGKLASPIICAECGKSVRPHHRTARFCSISCGATNSGRTHGLKRSPEYTTWRSMIQRCRNPHSTRFKNYGGRGIAVCERWLKFENFYADMGAKPSRDHSLDRIDNDGNYEPGNCRWATRQEQARGCRKYITCAGITRSVVEWSSELGIPCATIKCRLQKGWSVEAALTPPNRVTA